eukprot:jgi/Undpi1/3351/HiC_scaffold_15.g06724.m1
MKENEGRESALKPGEGGKKETDDVETAEGQVRVAGHGQDSSTAINSRQEQLAPDSRRLSHHPQQQQQHQHRTPGLRLSRSAPSLTRRPSRLQAFVAGLVVDVEEYMGRGGYEISPDDREDGDNIADSDDDDDDDVDTESTRLGRRAVGRSESDGGGSGSGWLEANQGEGAEGLDAALLTEMTPGFAGGEPPPRNSPQDFILQRARSSSASQYGGNSVRRTVITFLKGMVGSYVLYLPRMFAEGGMLFAAAALVLLSLASTYNMLLLLRCRESLARRGISACSYGQVGHTAFGRMGWFGVDVSLFLSQLGYCVVYLIFVAQNLGPLLRKVLPSEYRWLAGTLAILMVQACVQVPLSWVRRLKYLGAGMLVANACVVGGLLLILIEVVRKLAEDGAAGDASGGGIVLVNPGDCLILLGSVVGCFEGIGLVLPIQDAMDLRVRDRLPAALCWSMAGITAFFVSFGAFGYLAYGRDVANFITMDLPEETIVGTTVRVMYSVGLVLTSPLQLFPAVKVLERVLWPEASSGASKKLPDGKRKWLKNLLRAGMVTFTVVIALVRAVARRANTFCDSS